MIPRAQLISHPLLLLAAVLLLVAAVTRGRAARPSSLPIAFGASALLLYVLVVIWYVFQPQYFDHAEPSIAAVSWLLVRGGVLYHAPDASVCYAHPYGPVLYLAHGLALSVLGPGVAASKAIGAAAGAGSLVLLCVALRDRPWRERVSTTGLVAAAYLAFGNMTFWTRAEPQLLFWVALSLVFVNGPSPVAAGVAGIAAGLGANLKITGALCFLPAAASIWRTHGTRALLLTGVIAAIVFAAPFMLDRVSPSAYVYWLSEAAHHGVRLRSLPTETEWALVLLAPAAAAFVSAYRSETRQGDLQPARLALMIGVLATIPFAAKQGGGINHFIAFLPAIAFVAPRRGVLILSLAIAAVTIAVVQQIYWIGTVVRSPSEGPVSELRAFEAGYQAPMSVGYSERYRLSFFRPLLVFDGNPYELDAPALMGHELAGKPFPAAAVAALRSCSTKTWLIAAGGDPFVLQNAYDGTPVFPPEFIAAFHQTYRRVAAGAYFDVWTCAGAAPLLP